MSNTGHNSRDAIETLAQTEVFSGLDDEDRARVARRIKWKSFARGVEIVPYKGESDDVYFIASGRVRVTIFSFTGKEVSYQELGPGEMFGELSAIDQMPRTANVISLEKSKIGVMSGRDFIDLINCYPEVAIAALRRLAAMVRFLVDRVFQYGALHVKERVRLEVLRLAREVGGDDDIATISDFPTHREIANRVNTHREAVTREINELSRMGLIEQNQRVLTVTSIAKLTALIPEEI
jgi:CRP-like cAMP-binding protein